MKHSMLSHFKMKFFSNKICRKKSFSSTQKLDKNKRKLRKFLFRPHASVYHRKKCEHQPMQHRREGGIQWNSTKQSEMKKVMLLR